MKEREEIDKLFEGNQGYPNIENIPSDFIADLDDRLDDLMIDKLFNDNQGFEDIKDIPQDFIDDLDLKLDQNIINKKTEGFSPYRWLFISLISIVSIILFFNLKDKNKTSAQPNNSGGEIEQEGELSIKSEHPYDSKGNKKFKNAIANESDHQINENQSANLNNTTLDSETRDINEPITNNEKKNRIDKNKNDSKPIAITTKTERESNKNIIKNKTIQTNNKEKPNNNIKAAYLNTASEKSAAKKDKKRNFSKNSINEDSEKIGSAGLLKSKFKSKQTKNTKSIHNNNNSNDANILQTQNENETGIKNTLTNKVNKENDHTKGLSKNDSSNTLKKEVENITKLTSIDSLKDDDKTSNISKATITVKDSACIDVNDTTNTISNNTNVVKPNPKAEKWIQLNFGGMNVYSSFESKNATYDKKRKNEENSILVGDASLLINYKIHQIIFTTGINYTQFGEKIKYSSKMDTVNYIESYDTSHSVRIVNNRVTVTPIVNSVKGEKYIENTQVTKKNGVNRYTYLSIPFCIGYSFNISDYSIIPRIGGSIGIPLNKNGYYINSSSNDLVKETSRASLINYQVELELRYLNFNISPFYRKNLFNLIQSQNTKNIYSGIGILIGYSFKF